MNTEQQPLRRCEGCGKPLSSSQRRWCSLRCSRKYHNSLDRHQGDPHPYIIAKMRKTRKQRPCLGCGDKFMSEGNWNRLCPKCSARKDNSGRVVKAKAVYDWQERF